MLPWANRASWKCFLHVTTGYLSNTWRSIDGRSWAGTSGKRRSGFTALMRSTIMVLILSDVLALVLLAFFVYRWTLKSLPQGIDSNSKTCSLICKNQNQKMRCVIRCYAHLPACICPWFTLNVLCNASTLSLQANNSQVMSRLFSRYKSPLSPFASFRSATHLDSFSTVDTFLSSTLTSSLPLLSLDTPVSQQLSTLLRPLKEGTLLKLDPKRAICQFEIPGAGKCRDATCSNVHLRAFDPNGEFTCQP